MRPVIALLTDFGLRDHYVGAMKGVMLGICPDAALVDVSHDVPGHDIVGAAWELRAAYRSFPAGTIFLVVVDPGVGSTRRALAVEAGPYKFVAPDNGVLSAVFEESPVGRAVELSESRYARAEVSRTFEGRDRFAPAAAWLATGLDLSALGHPVDGVRRLDLPKPRVNDHSIDGEIIRIDRFGNLITNIDRLTFEQLRPAGSVAISVGAQTVAGVVSTYSDVPAGDLCAFFGSSNQLEIAANGSSAASTLGVERGAPVLVTGS